MPSRKSNLANFQSALAVSAGSSHAHRRPCRRLLVNRTLSSSIALCYKAMSLMMSPDLFVSARRNFLRPNRRTQKNLATPFARFQLFGCSRGVGQYSALRVGAYLRSSFCISHSDALLGQNSATFTHLGVSVGGFVLEIEAWLEPPRRQFVTAAHRCVGAGGPAVRQSSVRR